MMRTIPDRTRYRWLEALPGLAVWLTLVAAVVFSFVRPVWAVVFILLFDVYWCIRVLYVMVYVILAFRRYQQTQSVNWLATVKKRSDWRNIYHVIILPTYREPIEVLRQTFRSLSQIQYPLDRCLVVLATEGREAERVRPIARQIQTEFKNTFRFLMVTEHPDDLVGELASKGANITWAGRAVKEKIDEFEIPYDHIVVSTFDVDSIAHPQYFAYLAETFLAHPNRLRSSYQPIPVFHNNIWDALFLMRVVANSTTFWLLSETQRPDRLFTFSSHSMPWQALVDVDFWQTDVVNEDSRIFVQCFLHYDGDYTVTPLHLPISMDTVHAPGWIQSIKNQYYQIQRWAYGGVENFPYTVWYFLRNQKIPFGTRLRLTWIQWEGIFSWATAPILIFILGWLPFTVASAADQELAIIQNGPRTIQVLMSGAMLGLILSAVLSTAILPRRLVHVPWHRWIMMLGQWLFLPITMIVFGSLPAIDAQTRMMLGKYMGFVVTEKNRRSGQP